MTHFVGGNATYSHPNVVASAEDAARAVVARVDAEAAAAARNASTTTTATPAKDVAELRLLNRLASNGDTAAIARCHVTGKEVWSQL